MCIVGAGQAPPSFLSPQLHATRRRSQSPRGGASPALVLIPTSVPCLSPRVLLHLNALIGLNLKTIRYRKSCLCLLTACQGVVGKPLPGTLEPLLGAPAGSNDVGGRFVGSSNLV